MEFNTAKRKIAELSVRLNYSILLIAGLVICLIIVLMMLRSALNTQKTIVVPATIRQPFTISQAGIDNSYLKLMGTNFAMQRLSVTPDTVEANHKTLLQYTDPKFYHGFLDILNREAETIEKQKISSVFYPTEVVASSKKLAVLIKGELQRWSASVPLKTYNKTYLVKFSYRNGNLKILSFAELRKDKKV